MQHCGWPPRPRLRNVIQQGPRPMGPKDRRPLNYQTAFSGSWAEWVPRWAQGWTSTLCAIYVSIWGYETYENLGNRLSKLAGSFEVSHICGDGVVEGELWKWIVLPSSSRSRYQQWKGSKKKSRNSASIDGRGWWPGICLNEWQTLISRIEDWVVDRW